MSAPEKSPLVAWTLAPWSRNGWPRADNHIAIGAVGTPLVCLVPLRDVSINEQLANARLIEAAPELAAELAVHVEHSRETLDDLGPCDHSVGICYCGLREDITRAQALLDRIQGAA